MPRVEARLRAHGILLPEPARPVGDYRAYRVVDGWIFTSGQLSWHEGRIAHPGLLGRDVSLDEGKAAARYAALNLLAQLRAACDGDLDRISACVRLSCFLACTGDFQDHPAVLDPDSAILVMAFGDDVGPHARLAYGASGLPLRSPIEIEGVFKMRG